MRSLVALGLALVSLSACSGADPQADDTGEAELSSNRNSGYFVVTRPDARRCVSPLCGGYFVKRVNAAKTACADASYHAECSVSQIDLTALAMSSTELDAFNTKLSSGGGLVRASIHKFVWNGNHLGNLVATEGWAGATGSTATGDFYRVADNGIRCVRAPCASTSASKLNTTQSSNVSSVDFTSPRLAASAADLDAANRALGTSEGVLVAGTVASAALPSTEFYTRVAHSTVGDTCGGRGQQACGAGQYCSWTAAASCGAADASGTCTVKPEVCPEVYRPVCGCDGHTYSNGCFAGSAGASVAHDGACPVR